MATGHRVASALAHSWATTLNARQRQRRYAAALSLAVLVALALAAARAQGFPDTAADAAQQWYLAQDQAWSAWSTQPTLAPVKVAVLDSGIDAGDPAFSGKIAAGKSFVGGSWSVDNDGHGTFVAGLIAANPAESAVAGMAFNAELLVAKIVDSYGVIPPAAEVAAIHWAVGEGARVINLSWGAQRDPGDSEFDGYQRAERDAVEWAYARGVLVVAAAGNGTNSPVQPWPYADYPAWLPNVLSVAALDENGSVPAFSNRDPRRIDLAAPGAGILSTIPRNLEQTADDPSCAGVPYSNCGPPEFSSGNGTSFAAPQVAAAAALLLGVDPRLSPDQLIWLLERSATDMTPANGCSVCTVGHDAATGFGRLDVAAALALLRHATLPAPDLLEPDDDSGSEAHPLAVPSSVSSTLDYWDDPDDVFALTLRRGERLSALLTAPAGAAISLRLWKPRTPDLISAGGAWIAASSPASGVATVELAYRAPRAGVYDLELVDGKPAQTRAAYRLTLGAQAAPRTRT